MGYNTPQSHDTIGQMARQRLPGATLRICHIANVKIDVVTTREIKKRKTA